MSSDMPLPLFTVESDGDIADTVAQVVQLELASGFDEVVVLLGRVALGRPYHRVLHDRTANAISRAVGRLPHAMVAMMTVANT